jgi:hypothetical protein
MTPETPTQDRPLHSDDPALHLSWGLLEFLALIGADEFAVRFMYCGDDAAKESCDRLMHTLAFASLSERTRECPVTYPKESNPRSVDVWRFDAAALTALREIMPVGILASNAWKEAWAEDFCVYRRGELLFGTVTHERNAFLRLTDAEWRQWEAQSRAGR